jgi:hypothetical protein
MLFSGRLVYSFSGVLFFLILLILGICACPHLRAQSLTQNPFQNSAQNSAQNSILSSAQIPAQGPAQNDLVDESLRSPHHCLEFVPWPQGLKEPKSLDNEDILNAYLGMAYRVDGVVSEDGYFTIWRESDKRFKSPGLNCSGFLLSAARFLLHSNFPLSKSKNDYFNDSGPDSPLGEDWDFGLDVALNLAGWDAPMLPEVLGPTITTNQNGRKSGLGVNIHGPDFLPLIESLKDRSIYFFAISKPDRRFPSGVSYYHNGIILTKDSSAFLYHATRRAGVHRLDLRNPKSLNTFKANFPTLKNKGERKILFVEARPKNCQITFERNSTGQISPKSPALVF